MIYSSKNHLPVLFLNAILNNKIIHNENVQCVLLVDVLKRLLWNKDSLKTGEFISIEFIEFISIVRTCMQVPNVDCEPGDIEVGRKRLLGSLWWKEGLDTIRLSTFIVVTSALTEDQVSKPSTRQSESAWFLPCDTTNFVPRQLSIISNPRWRINLHKSNACYDPTLLEKSDEIALETRLVEKCAGMEKRLQWLQCYLNCLIWAKN